MNRLTRIEKIALITVNKVTDRNERSLDLKGFKRRTLRLEDKLQF